MSIKATNQVNQQQRLDLQNELTITNQLLFSISNELQQIKEFTNPSGKFALNVTENAATMERLAGFVSLNSVDIENINPVRDAPGFPANFQM